MQVFMVTSPTVNLTAVTTSTNIALNTSGSVPGTDEIRVFNSGTATVHIEFGNSSAVTATTTASFPVAPGATEVFRTPQRTSHVAGITASGSSQVFFTLGQGA